MTTHEGKLKIILAYVDKIERIQSELRKIVPRTRRRRDLRDYSIEEITSDALSSTSLNPSSDSSQETKRNFQGADNCWEYSSKKWKTDQCENEDSDGSEDSRFDPEATGSLIGRSVISEIPEAQEFLDPCIKNDKSTECFIIEGARLEGSLGATKKINQDHPEPFDILNYFRFLRGPQTTSINANVHEDKELTLDLRESQNLQNSCSSDNGTKEIPSSVDAFVQTTNGTKIDFEPFDILDYFQFPSRPGQDAVTSSTSSTKPESNTEAPVGKSFNCRFSKFRKRSESKKSNSAEEAVRSEGFRPQGSPKKERSKGTKCTEQQNYKIPPLVPAPFDEVNLFRIDERPRGAAAETPRAPAGSSYQQVHASVMKLETGYPRLGARSQRTRENGRDEEVRVPVPRQRASWMMIKWVRPIGLRCRLARMLPDHWGSRARQQREQIKVERGEELMQRQHKQDGNQGRTMTGRLKHIGKLSNVEREPSERRRMEQDQNPEKEKHDDLEKSKKFMEGTDEKLGQEDRWSNRIRTKFRLARKDFDGHGMIGKQCKLSPVCNARTNRNPKELGRETKQFGLSGLFDGLSCIQRRSSRARVIVPYHYPGDMTPRLVERESIDVLDGAAETLRVISSAAKVSIGRGDNFPRRQFVDQFLGA